MMKSISNLAKWAPLLLLLLLLLPQMEAAVAGKSAATRTALRQPRNEALPLAPASRILKSEEEEVSLPETASSLKITSRSNIRENRELVSERSQYRPYSVFYVLLFQLPLGALYSVDEIPSIDFNLFILTAFGIFGASCV